MTFDASPTITNRPRPRWLKPVLYAVVGLVIFGIGVAAGGGDAEAAPAPTKTVTAEPEVITKTETKTVTEVPQICLDALDAADDFVAITQDYADLVTGHLSNDQRLFEQMAELDFESDWYLEDIGTFTTDIEALTERMLDNTYQTDAVACRDAD